MKNLSNVSKVSNVNKSEEATMGNVKSSMSIQEFKLRAAEITREKAGSLAVPDLSEEVSMKGFNYDKLALYGQSADSFKLAMMEAQYEESGSTIGFDFMTKEFLLSERKSKNAAKKAGFKFGGEVFDNTKLSDLRLTKEGKLVGFSSVKFEDLDDEVKVLILDQSEMKGEYEYGYRTKVNAGVKVALQQFVSYYNEENILVEFWMNMKKMPYGMKKPEGFTFTTVFDAEDIIEEGDNGVCINTEAIKIHARIAGIELDNCCYRAVLSGGGVSDLVEPMPNGYEHDADGNMILEESKDGMSPIEVEMDFNDRLQEYSDGVMVVPAQSYSDKDFMDIEVKRDLAEIMYGKSGNLSATTAINAGSWDHRSTERAEDKAATKWAKSDAIGFKARKKSSSWMKEDFLVQHDIAVEFVEALIDVEYSLAVQFILHGDQDLGLLIKIARYMRDLGKGQLNKDVYNYMVRLNKVDASKSAERVLGIIASINNEEAGVLDSVLADKGLAALIIETVVAEAKNEEPLARINDTATFRLINKMSA